MARDASMGVGNLQTRPLDQLTQQQLLLSNPALLQQYQQQQTQINGLSLNQQQAEQLKQSVNTLVQGSQQLHGYLQQSWQLLRQVMDAYNAMCNYAAELEKVVQVGYQQNSLANAMLPYVQIAGAQNQLANAFLQERDAVYAMADVQQQMLTDPVYLLHHSFDVWDRNLGIDKTAIDYISQLYLELANRFDQRYIAATGQDPYPQQQQSRQGIDPNYFKAFSQAQSQGNPKVGQVLQQMHLQKFGV